MFLVVSSIGITTVAGYSAAVKTAQDAADETNEKARIYRMPPLNLSLVLTVNLCKNPQRRSRRKRQSENDFFGSSVMTKPRTGNGAGLLL